MNADFFDRDYYERGIESRKSCYQNYRWIPELTVPMVMTMIDLLNIKRGDSVLDVGCAKGFVVKAFRMLNRNAWGVDISKYAIENADPAVKEYCYLTGTGIVEKLNYDFCIAKDVLEHVPYEEINSVLSGIKAKNLFVVVPLGEDKKYFAPANDFDLSHCICENAAWWISTIYEAGWKPVYTYDCIEGIKDSYERGTHGFFIAKKK